MFYEYNQNNSGGSFFSDDLRGISHIVIIEADSPNQADAKAEDIGLYFNGCDSGMDCDCCGDRWSSQGGWTDNGSQVPEHYGREIVNGKVSEPDEPNRWSNMKWMDGPEGYIHYLDGRVEAFDI